MLFFILFVQNSMLFIVLLDTVGKGFVAEDQMVCCSIYSFVLSLEQYAVLRAVSSQLVFLGVESTFFVFCLFVFIIFLSL